MPPKSAEIGMINCTSRCTSIIPFGVRIIAGNAANKMYIKLYIKFLKTRDSRVTCATTVQVRKPLQL